MPADGTVQFAVFLVELVIEFQIRGDHFAAFLIAVRGIFLGFIVRFHLAGQGHHFIQYLKYGCRTFINIGETAAFLLGFCQVFFQAVISGEAGKVQILTGFHLRQDFIDGKGKSYIMAVETVGGFYIAADFFQLACRLCRCLFSAAGRGAASAAACQHHDRRCQYQ